MNFSFFLAKRFFKANNKKGKRASNPAVQIAVFGIAMSICTMIVSIGIVKGFKKEITNKIIGFTSAISILDENSFTSPEYFPIVVDDSMLKHIKDTPNVAKVQKYSEKMGMLKTENSFATIRFKGIGENYSSQFIKSSLIHGSFPLFSNNKPSGKIIISTNTANDLHLKVGDNIFAYFFEKTIKVRKFEVAGIYQTNLKQFDKSYAITDLHTINRLNNWNHDQCSGVEISLKDFNQLLSTTKALKKEYGNKQDSSNGIYSVMSIKENPLTSSVFNNWLNLLNMNFWMILILVTIVSIFLMISGLLILILERTKTIGLLKSIGANNLQIRHIFLYYAIFIIGKGLIIGNILGIGLLFLQKQFSIISLNPEDYYVDTVPVTIPIYWIILLNLSCFIITLAALIIPSYIICKIQPAKTMRFE